MSPSSRIAQAILKQRGRFTARQISDASGVDATHVAAELTRWATLRRLTRHEIEPDWPRVTYELRDEAAVEAVAQGRKPVSGLAWRSPTPPATDAAADGVVARTVIEDCDYCVMHDGTLRFVRYADGDVVRVFSAPDTLALLTFLTNVRDHIEAQVAGSA